jgi:hypothetical protein
MSIKDMLLLSTGYSLPNKRKRTSKHISKRWNKKVKEK